MAIETLNTENLDTKPTAITIVVATHNEGKLVEIQRILETELGDLGTDITLVTAGSLHLPDPVETGVTFEENALLKARDVALRTGLPAIADDSGLIVDVMGAAPGILSARWAGVHGNDKANNALLLAQIEDIPDEKRTARFRCAAALVVPKHLADSEYSDSNHVEIESETVELGEMTGILLRGPQGERGFGYDPLFVPNDQPERGEQHHLTSAEMTSAEKNAISHRGKALRALVPSVRKLL